MELYTRFQSLPQEINCLIKNEFLSKYRLNEIWEVLTVDYALNAVLYCIKIRLLKFLSVAIIFAIHCRIFSNSFQMFFFKLDDLECLTAKQNQSVDYHGRDLSV